MWSPKVGELIETDNGRFEWKIPMFFSLDGDIMYYSRSFTFSNRSLLLGMFVPDADYGYLSVHLLSENEQNIGVDIRFSLSIKRKDGTLTENKFDTIHGTQDEHDIDKFITGPVLRNKKIELLPGGTLTIVCDLEIDMTIPPASEANSFKEKSVVMTEDHQGIRDTSSNSIKEHMKLIELDTLSDNIKSLFVNKNSCDVILRVQEKEFNAHKIILKARSSVFASMFNHDTLENQTGIIDIPDCDADSFHYFLEFLYCGKLENITSQNALHLYSISDKYNVQKLKCFCVEYMEQYLTENNVCDVIILADMYEESSLFTAAQDYFNNNAGKIMETSEWENLLKNNYRLANKVMKSVVSKLTNRPSK